jgi:hypothetical protein
MSGGAPRPPPGALAWGGLRLCRNQLLPIEPHKQAPCVLRRVHSRLPQGAAASALECAKRYPTGDHRWWPFEALKGTAWAARPINSDSLDFEEDPWVKHLVQVSTHQLAPLGLPATAAGLHLNSCSSTACLPHACPLAKLLCARPLAAFRCCSR